MELIPLESSISIKTVNDNLIANIIHKNISNKVLYIMPNFLPLEVKHKKTGLKLKQKVLLKKRDEITLEDYIELLPNKYLEEIFVLNDIFEFYSGCHSYIFSLYRGYYDPLTDETQYGDVIDTDMNYCKN